MFIQYNKELNKLTNFTSVGELSHHLQVIPAGVLMPMQCSLHLGHSLDIFKGEILNNKVTKPGTTEL